MIGKRTQTYPKLRSKCLVPCITVIVLHIRCFLQPNEQRGLLLCFCCVFTLVLQFIKWVSQLSPICTIKSYNSQLPNAKRYMKYALTLNWGNWIRVEVISYILKNNAGTWSCLYVPYGCPKNLKKLQNHVACIYLRLLVGGHETKEHTFFLRQKSCFCVHLVISYCLLLGPAHNDIHSVLWVGLYDNFLPTAGRFHFEAPYL